MSSMITRFYFDVQGALPTLSDLVSYIMIELWLWLWLWLWLVLIFVRMRKELVVMITIVWFNFTANFFISEEKVWVIKLNSHYFISVNNFYKIVNIFFNIFNFVFNKKNGKLCCSIIMSIQFYSILISLFWQLSGRTQWAWKGVGEGGRRKHHFREMRQPSAMSADDRGPVIGKWR
jgi:hypothetical protein